jgi:catechol 2,3-dioxygenase-like lactoylglutathione lyase family enzyme
VKLNHLNLTVTDVAAARNFLQTYFGMTDAGFGAANDAFWILRDEAGMVLSLMRNKSADYPGYFHIGFIQDDAASVDRLNDRMLADGLEVEAPKNFHGSWTYYVKAPGGFTVEVMAA